MGPPGRHGKGNGSRQPAAARFPLAGIVPGTPPNDDAPGENRMKRTLAVLLTVAALTAPLAGCSSKSKNVTGTVVSKNTDHERKTKKRGTKKTRSCHTEYELMVRPKGGDETEVDVSYSAYTNCVEGSSYPKCTTR